VKKRSLEKRSAFTLSLLVSFCIIIGGACIVAYSSYTKATGAARQSNEAQANLLAKLILEHQRATIGVLRSYASRPLLVTSVKRKDFEGVLRHLTDLTKNNPEVEWPFIANPDSTVWVNFPTDKRAYNKDLSARDWHKGIKKEWKPYVSSVFKMIVGEKDLAVVAAAPIFDERRKVIGILCITQSAVLFQKIFSEAGLPPGAHITLIDQEGHIIYSNRFLYRKEVIGYSSFESIKKTTKGEKGDVEIRDPSDGGRIKYISFAPIEGTGWSVIVEQTKSEVLRSEYSHFVLAAAISVLICAVVALSLFRFREKQRHIKKLEILTEELKDSEGKFRQLYEGSRDGYVLVDMEGNIKEFNHAYQQTLGYPEEELYKLTYEDLTPAKWHEMEAQILKEQIVPRGYSDNYEKEYIKKDRTVFPLELRTYLVRDKDGMPSGMWAFIRDITERKRAEEDIQRLSNEREQRLFELTVLNKELEAFSYSVSHDLRAPLRSIDGFSLALLEDHIDRLDETGKDYFRRIRSATKRMSELIDGLLILSRLTRAEMKRDTVDLSEMTKHLSIELQERQPDHPVEFVIAEGATARGDAVMLRVVMENLLGNAWKFTRNHPTARIEFGMMEKGNRQQAIGNRGGVIGKSEQRIFRSSEVEVRSDTATDTEVGDDERVFYVRDDGAGFDMAYSDKLFGIFQRLHTTADFPGIGIGLTTVQRIIHRHGGSIWAKGEVEKGATFFFTLP
jgi:PAS domain S-box-containing protein